MGKGRQSEVEMTRRRQSSSVNRVSMSSTTSICVHLLALHLLGEVYSSSSVTGVSKHMCSAPRIGSLVNVMVVVIMFTIFFMAMFFTILYLGAREGFPKKMEICHDFYH